MTISEWWLHNNGRQHLNYYFFRETKFNMWSGGTPVKEAFDVNLSCHCAAFYYTARFVRQPVDRLCGQFCDLCDMWGRLSRFISQLREAPSNWSK